MKGAVREVFGNAKGFLFNHKGTKAQKGKGDARGVICEARAGDICGWVKMLQPID